MLFVGCWLVKPSTSLLDLSQTPFVCSSVPPFIGVLNKMCKDQNADSSSKPNKSKFTLLHVMICRLRHAWLWLATIGFALSQDGLSNVLLSVIGRRLLLELEYISNSFHQERYFSDQSQKNLVGSIHASWFWVSSPFYPCHCLMGLCVSPWPDTRSIG